MTHGCTCYHAPEQHGPYGCTVTNWTHDRLCPCSWRDLPSDYEPCGQCGFDHSYEYPQAHDWHTENDHA